MEIAHPAALTLADDAAPVSSARAVHRAESLPGNAATAPSNLRDIPPGTLEGSVPSPAPPHWHAAEKAGVSSARPQRCKRPLHARFCRRCWGEVLPKKSVRSPERIAD